MALIDAMSLTEADMKSKSELLSEAVGFDPDACLSCMKCTSGCPAFRYLEFRPDRVVSLVKFGFIEELLSSGVMWQCVQCLKCTERCPQDVAPSDVVLLLRKFCLRRGLPLPEVLNETLSNILEFGWIRKPVSIISRKYESYTRQQLGLVETKPAPQKLREKLVEILTSGE